MCSLECNPRIYVSVLFRKQSSASSPNRRPSVSRVKILPQTDNPSAESNDVHLLAQLTLRLLIMLGRKPEMQWYTGSNDYKVSFIYQSKISVANRDALESRSKALAASSSL